MNKPIFTKSIVIYADDDQDDRELIMDAFEQYSEQLQVFTFKNGSDAFSYLSHINEDHLLPCLVILDINMPVMDGKETLISIRSKERLAAIPVVLFSTSTQPEDKTFAKQYSAGYITKPTQANQLEIIVGEFMNHCTEETRKRLKKGFI